MNEPRAPEVGDEESIDLIPVQQAELWGYNFIYLPCGHWYRFSNLENVFRDKGTCCLCRECYFPMQVKWVPPLVPNPAAAFQATNQLNEWVQCNRLCLLTMAGAAGLLAVEAYAKDPSSIAVAPAALLAAHVGLWDALFWMDTWEAEIIETRACQV